MNYKIASRMNYMLENDKITDPQRMCEILKEEIKPIIENYIYLQNDIRVRFKKEKEKNIFWVEIDADKIKPVGYIPY